MDGVSQSGRVPSGIRKPSTSGSRFSLLRARETNNAVGAARFRDRPGRLEVPASAREGGDSMLRHDSRKYAVVNGNENTLSGNLNSRVIQLVITKNLTLANAGSILDLVRTNKTGSSTAFPFFATSEFLTLGFAWEASKLVANTSVVNGGNYTVSPPPPPPNLWQLVWNTVAGWAERAWKAVGAAGGGFH